MNLSILDREDYVATEACQHGYDSGARSLVGGIGESLMGHWHNTWDAALSVPTDRIAALNGTRNRQRPELPGREARIVLLKPRLDLHIWLD